MANKVISDAFLRAKINKDYEGKSELSLGGNGLFVRISTKGIISFVYRYRFSGKPNKLKLGVYPTMSLKEAKDKHQKLYYLVKEGIDPRLKEAIGKTSKRPLIYNDLIKLYITKRVKGKNKAWKGIERYLLSSISPYIGEVKIKNLPISTYMDIFSAERERVSDIHTQKLLKRFRAMMNFAVLNEWVDFNPLISVKPSDVGVPSRPRVSKLTDIEIGAYWLILGALPRVDESVKRHLKLTQIFGSRLSELRLAEKQDFNFQTMVWEIPWEKHKIGRKTNKPLRRAIPKMAEDILKEQFVTNPDTYYVFPQLSGKDFPIDRKVISSAAEKAALMMGDLGFSKTTTHDMRRTARNSWEKLGFQEKVSEVMLGHVVHRGINAHYLDYDYLDDQIVQYHRWCEYICLMVDKYVESTKD